jgi:hypothetical protein
MTRYRVYARILKEECIEGDDEAHEEPAEYAAVDFEQAQAEARAAGYQSVLDTLEERYPVAAFEADELAETVAAGTRRPTPRWPRG